MSSPKPFANRIDLDSGRISSYERHSVRHRSDMAGYFRADPVGDDHLIYEYFERSAVEDRPELAGFVPPRVNSRHGC